MSDLSDQAEQSITKCTTRFIADSKAAKQQAEMAETGHFGLGCARHEVLLSITDMIKGESSGTRG